MSRQGTSRDDVVVLGPVSRWRYAGAALLTVILGLAALRLDTLLPLMYAAFGVAVLVNRWGDEVRLEEEALVVVHRGQRSCYRWEDLLELSWDDRGLTCGPVIRTVGTVWQTPGPAAPAKVAKLLSRRGAESALREAAGRHGVPYTPDLLRAVASGSRRPALPTDAARTAARDAAPRRDRSPSPDAPAGEVDR